MNSSIVSKKYVIKDISRDGTSPSDRHVVLPAGRNTVADTKEDGKVSGENGNEERDGDEGIDIDADSDDGSAFGDLFG
ncbi:unnamed protein product [Alternaria alternata]